MTWRIELAYGVAYYTDTPLDFDRMGKERWLAIDEIPRAVSGDLLRGRTHLVHINIAQIVTIEDVDL